MAVIKLPDLERRAGWSMEVEETFPGADFSIDDGLF